ncbi:hypothetical protein OIU78_020140 [Salix suchowensis]|nr:hypothetical protein OIU78_020140 [Salix suchowensis]
MKRLKNEPSSTRRFKLSHLLLGIGALYLVFLAFKFRHFLEIAAMLSGGDSYVGLESLSMVKDVDDSDLSKSFFSSVYKDTFHRKLEDNQNQNAPMMPNKEPLEEEKRGGTTTIKPIQYPYGRKRRRNATVNFSLFERMADEAWLLGLKAWKEVENYDGKEIGQSSLYEGKIESCPLWVSISGEELAGGEKLMFLPCGLAAGSSITIVGTPHHAHQEYVPQLIRLRNGDGTVMVSQFMIELQGLKSVEGEDPPKILHLNPRLRGDWSRHPVIEHNTCYRMQWGTAQRCDGLPSKKDEDMLGKSYLVF